ncbi:gp53-like domain-containing protein [Paraburkholderia sp. MM5477-R1]|uniref:gp53-like domain-containing protein n=1 Tax=Paraburkholderia sp. MM5477-R1 TaxID=2991062 RepID=UPI003D22A6E8
MNKVWRQSSIISAVLAQFICDRTGQPAIDDGTTATLLANLKLAAAALNGDVTQAFSVLAATASGQAINLGQFPATLSANGCVTIPVIVAGVKTNLLLQWLNGVSASSGIVTQAWPITFPNTVLSANSTYVSSGTALSAISATMSTNTTNSTCVVNVANSSSVAVVSANVKVIAVGY